MLFTSTAHANLMNVDIQNDGNYSGFSLDTDGYPLEWLDFGHNNKQSYNQVIFGLKNNWRVPTESEVAFLWKTLFLIPSDDADTSGYGENGFAVATALKWQGNYSLWLSYLSIMGNNHIAPSNSIEAQGWFEADNGNLSSALYRIIDDADG